MTWNELLLSDGCILDVTPAVTPDLIRGGVLPPSLKKESGMEEDEAVQSIERYDQDSGSVAGMTRNECPVERRRHSQRHPGRHPGLDPGRGLGDT